MVGSDLNVTAWQRLVQDDPEVVHWVQYGAPLAFSLDLPPASDAPNHPSALKHGRDIDDDHSFLLSHNMIEGPLSDKEAQATVISPRAVIPKRDSDKKRVIMDPFGVNPFLDKLPLKLPTVRHALAIIRAIGPGCFLAKADLEWGFLQFPISHNDRRWFGFRWRGKVWRYTRLVFGSSQSPFLFCRFTSAINRIFRREGIVSVVYMDDFLFFGSSAEACRRSMERAFEIFAELGVRIKAEKTVLPTQQLSFLGVGIDVQRQCLFIPEEKRSTYSLLLQELSAKESCSWHELASLVGKLSHVAMVCLAARPFLFSFWHLLYSIELPDRKHSDLVLSGEEVRADLAFWLSFLPAWQGSSFWRFAAAGDAPDICFATDASDTGFGALSSDGRALAGAWRHAQASNSSTWRELFTVLFALKTWAFSLRAFRVVVYTDNQAAMYIANKGSASSPALHRLVRKLYSLAATHDFSLFLFFVPREQNSLADFLSRFSASHWALARSGRSDGSLRTASTGGEHTTLLWNRLEEVPGLLLAVSAVTSAPFLPGLGVEPSSLLCVVSRISEGLDQ